MFDFSSGQLALLAALTGVWGASLTVVGGWGTLRRPEIHHFYWGVALLFVANALEVFGAPGLLQHAVGLVAISLILDDTIQHAYQAIEFARTGVVRFTSPWHDLYVWAVRRLRRDPEQ